MGHKVWAVFWSIKMAKWTFVRSMPLTSTSQFFWWFFNPHPICLLIWERGEGRGRGRGREGGRERLMWERIMYWLPPTHAPIRDWTHSLGMCPHWNGTRNVLLYRMMLQPTEPPGQGYISILQKQKTKERLHFPHYYFL